MTASKICYARPMASVCLALALAACGGGGGSETSVTPDQPVVIVPGSNGNTASPAPSPSPAPAPTPPTTTAPAPAKSVNPTTNAVYVGNQPAALAAYEAWLGERTEGIQLHTGRASWDDWESSIGWLAHEWKDVDRTKYWTIPLFEEAGNLDAAAAGEYDGHYRAGARALVDASPGDGPIHVRTGWEFNGDWQPWAASGKEAEYRSAFRKFVEAFRSVSDRFRFEWAPNIGDLGMSPEDAYPGDDVVDVIGLSFYVHENDPADPAESWSLAVTRTYGLQWQQDFARSHGKRTAMSEWGIRTNASGPIVHQAAEWFDRYDFLYHSYWDSNADYPGQLSSDQYPLVSDDYRRLFELLG